MCSRWNSTWLNLSIRLYCPGFKIVHATKILQCLSFFRQGWTVRVIVFVTEQKGSQSKCSRTERSWWCVHASGERWITGVWLGVSGPDDTLAHFLSWHNAFQLWNQIGKHQCAANMSFVLLKGTFLMHEMPACLSVCVFECICPKGGQSNWILFGDMCLGSVAVFFMLPYMFWSILESCMHCIICEKASFDISAACAPRHMSLCLRTAWRLC